MNVNATDPLSLLYLKYVDFLLFANFCCSSLPQPYRFQAISLKNFNIFCVITRKGHFFKERSILTFMMLNIFVI